MNWNRHGASLWKGMKWLLYAEVAAVAGGYYVWHRMNTNEEYRKFMHEKHPIVLEAFYRVAEVGGIKEARINDYRRWGVVDRSGSDEDTTR